MFGRAAALLLLAGLCAWGAAASWQVAENCRPSRVDTVLQSTAIPASAQRVLALGFRSALADLRYLQAVQIFGDHRYNSAPRETKRLQALAIYRLLDETTILDDRFDYAYVFGANTIPIALPGGDALNLDETVKLLRRGARNGGHDWRVPFYLGYFLDTYFGDFSGAAAALSQSARCPKRPEFVPLLATRLSAMGNSLNTGIKLAREMAANTDNPELRAQYLERVRLLDMERDLRVLEEASRMYHDHYGHFPSTPQDLIDTKLIPGPPEEPHGGQYVIDPATGKWHSTAAQRLAIPETSQAEIRHNAAQHQTQPPSPNGAPP